MDGYVRIHRKIFTSKKFRDNADRLAAIWLITHAAWKPMVVPFNGRKVALQRGECCYSIRFLMGKWGEKSTSAVSRRLAHFEAVGFIRRGREKTKLEHFLERDLEQQMERQVERDLEHPSSIITICKYSNYQYSDANAGTGNGTPSGTRFGTQAGTVSGTKNINYTKNLEDNNSLRSLSSSSDAEDWCLHPERIAFFRHHGKRKADHTHTILQNFIDRYGADVVRDVAIAAHALADGDPVAYLHACLANGPMRVSGGGADSVAAGVNYELLGMTEADCDEVANG